MKPSVPFSVRRAFLALPFDESAESDYSINSRLLKCSKLVQFPIVLAWFIGMPMAIIYGLFELKRYDLVHPYVFILPMLLSYLLPYILMRKLIRCDVKRSMALEFRAFAEAHERRQGDI